MNRGPQGTTILVSTAGEPYRAFVPNDLPPVPPLELDSRMQDLMDRANLALGRLDGMSIYAPELDIPLFLYFYVRKEAVLSSQIEGAQSSLADLLLFESSEMPGVPLDHVQEVSNYVAALEYAVGRLRADAPLTGRLLRETHALLLAKGRGSAQLPGEFRRSQNWIGGSRPGNARHVPPPHTEIAGYMAALERFLHDMPHRTPTLVKCALAHVQLETIHPFLEGNGRLGRLLITLILLYEGVLREPLLYLSLYFKLHREQYYDLLQRVRVEGDWETWLEFFLEGVRSTAEQASTVPLGLSRLAEADRARVASLPRVSTNAKLLLAFMLRHPVFSIPGAAEDTGLAHQTVAALCGRFADMGIVRQIGERRRNRIFCYDAYLSILNEGTEPLPP